MYSDARRKLIISTIFWLVISMTFVCTMVSRAELNTKPELGSPCETIQIAYARVEMYVDGMVYVQYYKDGKFGAFMSRAEYVSIEHVEPGENPHIDVRHFADGTIMYEIFVEKKETI